MRKKLLLLPITFWSAQNINCTYRALFFRKLNWLFIYVSKCILTNHHCAGKSDLSDYLKVVFKSKISELPPYFINVISSIFSVWFHRPWFIIFFPIIDHCCLAQVLISTCSHTLFPQIAPKLKEKKFLKVLCVCSLIYLCWICSMILILLL